MRRSISFITAFTFGILFTLHVSPISSVSAQTLKDSKRIFSSNEQYNKKELIIQYKQGTSANAKKALVNTVSATEAASLTNQNFSLLSLPASSNLAAAANSLLTHSEIVTVEPNYKIEQTYIPTDPNFAEQWYLKDQNFPEAWDLPKRKAVIKVAVIDGGVEVNHIDLKGQITKTFNVITRKKGLAPNDHGTHIAGIIAAAHNNIGTSGISPSSKIIPINVFRNEEAAIFDVAEGIYYAIDAGADIINLSLTTEVYTSILNKAVQAATARGVIVIAAAGNEHTANLRYPAALKNVIGVSAIDKNDKIASFSNFGKYIDFTAPGKDILSTVSGSNFGTMSGTSMASPMISGITALILTKNPFLSPTEVLSIFKASSVDLGSKGWDPQYGYGKINAYTSLENTPDPMSTIELSENSFIIDGSNKLKISFKAHKDTFVSLYAEDSNGKSVKNMLTNKSSTGDTMSYNWDGTLENEAYHSSGNVKLVLKTANARHTLTNKKTVELKNTLTPKVTFTKSAYLYSAKVNTKLPIRFQLNKESSIKAVILDSTGKNVRTLQESKVFKGGPHTIEWNGTNSARSLLKDGNYMLSMFLRDSDGLTGTTKNVPITLDTVAPVGTTVNSTSTFKRTGKTKIKNTITVKEAVTASVSIIDKNGKIIKRIIVDHSFKAGRSTVPWNGQTTNKKAAVNGDYRFNVILKDAAGNTRIINSPSFRLLNP